jgi:hypothetical protein
MKMILNFKSGYANVQALMNILLPSLLAAGLLFTASGCRQVEKDVLSAQDDDQFERYGLDTVKLGGQRAEAGKQLEALLNQPLQCKRGTATLGDKHKAYATETCVAVPVNGQAGQLWDENVTALSAVFVENQLCKLSIQLQTSGDYQALSDKHGMKILNLFGKPDELVDRKVVWQRHGDQTTMQDMGNGKVSVDISNARVMQVLHHSGG